MTKGTLLVVCEVLGLPSSLNISSALLSFVSKLLARGICHCLLTRDPLSQTVHIPPSYSTLARKKSPCQLL